MDVLMPILFIVAYLLGIALLGALMHWGTTLIGKLIERLKWKGSIGRIEISYSEYSGEFGNYQGEAHEKAQKEVEERYGKDVGVVLVKTDVSSHIHFGDTYTYIYKVMRKKDSSRR